jgi:hypothetical protein
LKTPIFKVRPAVASDFERILSIDRAENQPIRGAVVRGAIDRGECLVAECNEEQVGFGVMNYQFFDRAFVRPI